MVLFRRLSHELVVSLLPVTDVFDLKDQLRSPVRLSFDLFSADASTGTLRQRKVIGEMAGDSKTT